ncbi:MAG: lysophospholipid acyltransferase family protein [Cytophagales bacterium]|nr:1-acyl-sn-glycerol-3-phosphate acyltransferase [Bernardetiaceae bacterium]MDW8205872.1 lysophospholipid acyltransferase family protein [Cytophagales bacterium]
MPFAVIGSWHQRWHVLSLVAYKIWGTLLFVFGGLPVKVVGTENLPKDRPYILTPNHVSYLDVPLMVYAIPDLFVFVGKSSLGKIPIFGYIFRRVHIPVNRVNPKSGLHALQKAKQRLAAGRSVLIFPEGGFGRIQPPALAPFKEGAFRLAVETGAPIVPVTMPFNWQILPERSGWHIYRRQALVIIHPPIETKQLTLANVDTLKDQTYHIIASELTNHFPASMVYRS